MKLKLEIEVEYDSEMLHADEWEWFRDEVLLSPAEDEGLILHSNCLGDEIGSVKVLKILSDPPLKNK